MRQYEAAIYAYNSILREYPDTEYKEDILFSILKSNYNFAENSVLSKQKERYQATLDAYNELVFQFPETKYFKEARNMNRSAMDYLQIPEKSSDIN
jgi:outer membrane protein assembly factor BamD